MIALIIAGCLSTCTLANVAEIYCEMIMTHFASVNWKEMELSELVGTMLLLQYCYYIVRLTFRGMRSRSSQVNLNLKNVINNTNTICVPLCQH